MGKCMMHELHGVTGFEYCYKYVPCCMCICCFIARQIAEWICAGAGASSEAHVRASRQPAALQQHSCRLARTACVLETVLYSLTMAVCAVGRSLCLTVLRTTAGCGLSQLQNA